MSPSDNVENMENFSMFDLFRIEVESQLGELGKNLLALENDLDSPKYLEALMRAAHSLKGAARMVGVDAAIKISHVMEDCFVAAQKGKLSIGSDHVDILLSAADMIELISKLDDAEQTAWDKNHEPDLNSMLVSLSNILEESLICDKSVSQGLDAKNDSVRNTPPDIDEEDKFRSTVLGESSGIRNASDDRMLRINADRVSRIMGMTGELLVETRGLRTFSESLYFIRRKQDELMRTLDVWGHAGSPQNDENDIEHKKEMMHRLDAIRMLLNNQIAALDEYDRKNSNLTSKLYHEVVGSRMQPFSDGVAGFNRMVRDVARKLSKDINFEIHGLSVPVDRDVLEKIKSPLNHLLRNSIDHGVESAEDRACSGKPKQAKIILSASHGNGMLRISVEDDGAGIDLEKIKKKLFIQGLVEENILENLTDSELLEFLFLPDFSTRDFVTEVSGRGVGLDVVRNMVRELGGTVNVKNMRECGTKFILFLPLTLSVISALIVEVSGEPYAFPLSRIDRILKIQSSDILLIEGRQYIRQGDENIGLISCSQVFGFDEMKNHTAELTVIVISDHLGRYGVVVDESVTQRQLSVQALDARMGKVRNMSSAALMENGDPLFIVDVDDMVRSIERIVTGGVLGVVYAQTEGKIKLNRKCILIVDDSLTVREVERNLLESRGYQVEVAVDGMDGWNAVHSAKYDLIITDVDMPRMDGIELVKSIRQDIRLEKLPIMIVSYKDRQEDRSRGLSAGADYYLTKGSMHDDSLLEAVIDLIGEAAG